MEDDLVLPQKFEVPPDPENSPEDVQLAFALGKAYRNGYDQAKMEILRMMHLSRNRFIPTTDFDILVEQVRGLHAR